jgi:type IV secretory pathway VirJ component
MLRRRRSFIVLAILTPILGALGFLSYMGWFGGPVYRLFPASVAAPSRQRGTVAVFLSGDSGLNIGMGSRVVQAIADQGVPVLAVNSLTAFAHRRTPDEVRAMIAETTRHALALPGARRVILIGQSFGADMLQYGVAGMPSDLRPRIAQVILAVPGETLLFKATPGGFLDGAPDLPALPSARAIDWLPVTCIHGLQEENSLCPLLHGRNVRVVALPGDHYLRHDAGALVGAIWQAIQRRS